MRINLETAILSNCETSLLEFKESFDISSSRDWCEIIKDIVAIANSGEGTIIFGLDSFGVPNGMDVSLLYTLDPADITNRINKYTGYQFSEFKLQKCEKSGQQLFAIVIQNVTIPIVFEKPGTYNIGGGNQKTAFGVRTVYFRHGAKSEPGNTEDLRRIFDKNVEVIRESWLKNVKQVIEAPLGTTFLTIQPNVINSDSKTGSSQEVKIVESPNGLPVYLKEEDLLKFTPYDYKTLTDLLSDRYSNFVKNNDYHKLRKSLENNSRYCKIRYLDPNNEQGNRKCFYSANIFEEFDKHYLLKPKN